MFLAVRANTFQIRNMFVDALLLDFPSSGSGQVAEWKTIKGFLAFLALEERQKSEKAKKREFLAVSELDEGAAGHVGKTSASDSHRFFERYCR